MNQKILDERKAVLRKQIESLKHVKNKTKENIDSFEKVDDNNINSVSFFSSFSESEVSNSVIINLKNKRELIDLAGIRCVKNNKEEVIFEFLAEGEDHKQIIYFVQLSKINNELQLGKWNFPIFLDATEIFKETIAENAEWIYPFIRNCKHYIDCNHNRMLQYNKFKNSLEEIANCCVNTDQTYVYINIELLKVYDVKSDANIDIIVYLQYNLNETRPFEITIDSKFGPPLKQETSEDLSLFLAPFKKFDMTKAINIIEKNKNPYFFWKRKLKDLIQFDDVDLEDILPDKRRRLNSSRNSKQEIFEKKKKSVSKKPGILLQKKSEISKKRKSDITHFFSPISENTSKTKDVKSPVKKNSFEKRSNSQSENNILENSEDGRILRSRTNSPKKVTTPVKNIPKKKEPPRRLISPKKVPISKKLVSQKNEVFADKFVFTKKPAISKKVDNVKKLISPKKVPILKKLVSRKNEVLANKLVSTKKPAISKRVDNLKKLVSPKTIVSREISNVKLKQTNLKIQYPENDSPSTRKGIININSGVKHLRSKVVTSTPLSINSKITRPSLVADFNISEIKAKKIKQTTKSAVKKNIKSPKKIRK